MESHLKFPRDPAALSTVSAILKEARVDWYNCGICLSIKISLGCHYPVHISYNTLYIFIYNIYTILQCRRIHIYTHILHKVYLREYSKLKLKLSSLAGKSRGTFLDGSALHPNSASHDFFSDLTTRIPWSKPHFPLWRLQFWGIPPVFWTNPVAAYKNIGLLCA
jgi:hypothetical protein